VAGTAAASNDGKMTQETAVRVASDERPFPAFFKTFQFVFSFKPPSSNTMSTK